MIGEILDGLLIAAFFIGTATVLSLVLIPFWLDHPHMRGKECG